MQNSTWRGSDSICIYKRHSKTKEKKNDVRRNNSFLCEPLHKQYFTAWDLRIGGLLKESVPVRSPSRTTSDIIANRRKNSICILLLSLLYQHIQCPLGKLVEGIKLLPLVQRWKESCRTALNVKLRSIWALNVQWKCAFMSMPLCLKML